MTDWGWLTKVTTNEFRPRELAGSERKHKHMWPYIGIGSFCEYTVETLSMRVKSENWIASTPGTTTLRRTRG